MARPTVEGIHHVTGAVTNPQRDYDFYTKTLGMRLVKQTVNHETADMWHFFYGDYNANVGTIMTNIIFPEKILPRCTRGRGTISELSYSVPAGSIAYWRARLTESGYACEDRPERFGEKVLYFEDPEGLPSEIIESADARDPGPLNGIPAEHLLRGFHSVTLVSRLHELSLGFFTQLLGFEVAAQEGNRTRLAVKGGGPGRWVDLVDVPEGPWAQFGMGAIHHVAFTVPTVADMQRFWGILSGAGLIVTDLRDRKWFHSAYLTEPGGINVEISNVDPGFTVDEELEHLGETLQLPKQWAARQDEIAAVLPELVF